MSDAPEFQYRGNYVEWLQGFINPRRNQKNFRALVRAIGLACQHAEDLVWDVWLSNQLDNATGITLVYAGRKVGEEKGQLDDQEFKRIISARLRIAKTRSEPDDLIEIFKAVTGAEVVKYFGGASAFVLVAHRQAFMREEYRVRVRQVMRLAKPLGVHMELVEALLESESFTYNDGPGYNVGRYARVL